MTTRGYAYTATGCWLLFAAMLWLPLRVGAAEACTYRGADAGIITELQAGPLTCKTYRGLAADLAVLLAPSRVSHRARAVVVCYTRQWGILQVLDKRGRVLCSQMGRGVDDGMVWEGASCGWQ